MVMFGLAMADVCPNSDNNTQGSLYWLSMDCIYKAAVGKAQSLLNATVASGGQNMQLHMQPGVP